MTLATIDELLTVDKSSWLEDVENIKKFYAQVGERVPNELYKELKELDKELDTKFEVSIKESDELIIFSL